jgi:hypothetical protein
MSKALVESDAIGSVIAQACGLFQERLQRCIENILYIIGMICNEKFNIQFSHMRCMPSGPGAASQGHAKSEIFCCVDDLRVPTQAAIGRAESVDTQCQAFVDTSLRKQGDKTSRAFTATASGSRIDLVKLSSTLAKQL